MVVSQTESPWTPRSELGPYRAADYFELPDEPRYELIYGRFYLSPSPVALHQFVLTVLAYQLHAIARKEGALAFVAPLDTKLFEHSVVQPDLLYFTAARKHLVRGGIESPPDLVVEILSPGTERRDRGEKLRLYMDSGVREYWLVDAERRNIEFLVNRDGGFQIVLPEDDRYQSDALPELWLDIAALWTEVDEQLL